MMEFFLGTFQREWERRRAALLHEMQMGKHRKIDWDMRRRGGSASLPPAGLGGGNDARRQRSHAFESKRSDRSMRQRFVALARGSQPAVVKLASYGSGRRAGALMSYVSRSGELSMETERGQRIVGKAELTKLRQDWEPFFDNRCASRDIGIFEVSVAGPAVAEASDHTEIALEVLKAGLGDRRFVYALVERDKAAIDMRGVVVLRDMRGARLTADAKATVIVQQRIEKDYIGRKAEVRFSFRGYGNGSEFATARVRDLIEKAYGRVHDETGRSIGSAEEAGDLVQRDWRREFHSRKGRDIMHLLVSARAGTDASAFQAAVRDFLARQFCGHRYVFALHDPADDPKETGQGGKRPHVHVHAVITMRSETGERIVTSPQVFRQWRALMAETARYRGIDMELTDRRDLASSPAYSRNQIRPVSYLGRTEHEGTSLVAQARYDAKRVNRRSAVPSQRSVGYLAEAQRAWEKIAHTEADKAVCDFAVSQSARLRAALAECQIDIETLQDLPNSKNSNAYLADLEKLIGIGDAAMRAMTRSEFEAYEQRVEAVLANVEAAIGPSEKSDFDQVAATAREVVSIRREYLELTARYAMRPEEPALGAGNWDSAVAKHGRATVVQGNEVMLRVQIAREARDLAIAEGRDPSSATADIKRELDHAARLSFAGNGWLREIAETDRGIKMAIDLLQEHRPDDRSQIQPWRDERPDEVSEKGHNEQTPQQVRHGQKLEKIEERRERDERER